MALALTEKERSRTVLGNKRFVVFDIAWDSSYPTGGESLSAADVGMTEIENVAVSGGAGGYFFDYDTANSKMLAYYYDYNGAADGAAIQVANTTDLSGVTALRASFMGF